MEIEIQSKTDNPLLNRTEVRFVVIHKEGGTPKRELIRSELADKLNVKKENIMVNMMKSHFGLTETFGYAKIYKSVDKAKDNEKHHILKRNNVPGIGKKRKEEKTKDGPPIPEQPKGETSKPEPKKEETPQPPKEEKESAPVEEKKEGQNEVTEDKKQDEKTKEEQPKEEKKE